MAKRQDLRLLVERELERVPAPGNSDQAGIKTISKVGRNELCPCGSGKKFKKCCCMN